MEARRMGKMVLRSFIFEDLRKRWKF